MWFYIILWGIFALGVFINKKTYPSSIFVCLFAIISLLVGYRYDVGSDWLGYVDFYNKKVETLSGSEIVIYEPLYYLMNLILAKLGVSHCIFLAVFNFICMMCLYKAIVYFRINNVLLSILLYISLYFCMLNMNIIRQGMAVCLFFLAFSYYTSGEFHLKEKRIKFIVCLLAAIGFHYFSVVLFLLTPLLVRSYCKKTVLFIVIISFVFVITSFTARFMPSLANLQLVFAVFTQKMDTYINNEDYQATLSLSIGYCFSAAVVLFSRFNKKNFYIISKRNSFLVNCILMGMLIMSLLSFNSAFAERFSNSLIVANVFLIPALVDCFETKKNRAPIIVFLFIYMLLYYNKIVYNPDPAGIKPYEFYPYIVNFNQ